MLNRRRLAGALVALIVFAMSLLTGVTSATADAPSVPPACAQADRSLDCVHASTPDITALPSPTFTTTYDIKTRTRTVTVDAAFPAPYPQCPGGGSVPTSALPCSQPGFSMSPRVYVPGATVGADNNGVAVPGQTCVFTCTMTFTLGSTYYGPATIILSYTLGDILATATNDLFLSTYENTITLPTDPFAGAVTVTRPTVVLTGVLKSQTVTLAGKGGIPKSGVGGVLAIITTSGGLDIKGSNDYIANGQPQLVAIIGPTVRLIKEYPGTFSITTVGWWASTPSDTGNLLHKYYLPIKLPAKGKTLALTRWHVPADASGVLINVLATKKASRVGGVLVPKGTYPELILVPLGRGATVALNTISAGTTVSLVGYVSPAKPVDAGLSLSIAKAPEILSELINSFPPSAE